MADDISTPNADGESDATPISYELTRNAVVSIYFEDEDGVQEGVLGVSIGDTGVIAMFKPVLAGSEALPRVVRFGEQTTFIHEFAHAVGLVNRGIPLTSEHHDVENGAHCSNPRCVMYWANARLLSLLDFVRNFIDSGDTIVFAEDCLNDVDAFSSTYAQE